MQMKPEERAKAIGLGVATAAVFGFGVMRIVSAMHTSSPSATAENITSGQTVHMADQAIPSASSAIGVPNAPGAPLASITSPGSVPVYGGSAKGTKLDLYAENLNDPNATRDPFTPVLPQANQGIGRPLPVRPTFTAIPTQQRLPGTTVMPAMQPRPPAMTYVAPNSDAALMLPGGKSVLDGVVLAGVITGPYAVAVLHIGDRSYELVGGEKLPYGMSLARITDTGVYMRRNGRMMFMEIGKSLHSAMSIRTSSRSARQSDGVTLSAVPMPSAGEITQQRGATVQVGSSEGAGN